MAAYNKFQDFVEQLGLGVHNFSTHTFKVALTNTAPVATNTILANITQISGTNGYTTGGTAATAGWTETTGTAKLTLSDVVFTAAGGAMGPFRYVVIYNDTATSPVDALIGWYDYGSSITLNDTETFTVDFDGAAGVLTIA